MTLTELRYVLAVAQERHFGKAAQACFVTQPTLSLGIKKLEDELGVALFERKGKHEVRLTDVGEQVVQRAARILEEVDAIKATAQAGVNPLVGPLRLGVIYSIAPYLLPRLIPLIHKSAPQMPIYLEENYTHVLTQQLKNGQLDVIVIALPFNEPGIVTQAVYDEAFVAAVPRDHRWAGRRNMPMAELAQENVLLLGAGHCFRDQVLQACPECSGSPGKGHNLEGGSLETIAHMVATGVGVTVLPMTAAAKWGTEGLVSTIPFSEPAPSRRIALAWRKSFPRAQAVEILRQTLLQAKLPEVTYCKDAVIRF